jgi:hypothetical protein
MLHDEGVEPAVRRHLGLVAAGHRGQDCGPGLAERLDNGGIGQPECEADQFNRILQQEVDLGLPGIVVVKHQRWHAHVVARCVPVEAAPVLLQPGHHIR